MVKFNLKILKPIPLWRRSKYKYAFWKYTQWMSAIHIKRYTKYQKSTFHQFRMVFWVPIPFFSWLFFGRPGAIETTCGREQNLVHK